MDISKKNFARYFDIFVMYLYTWEISER